LPGEFDHVYFPNRGAVMNIRRWINTLRPSRKLLSGRLARKLRLVVELLEDRTLLSGSPYLPPSYMMTNPHGLLTGPSQGDPLQIALGYLKDHASELRLTPADLATPHVTSEYTDADTGITHIYLCQTVNHLDVEYADLSIHVDAQGEVIAAGGGFVPGLAGQLANTATTPALSATQAVEAAAQHLNMPLDGDPTVVSLQSDTPDRSTVVSAPQLSLDNITAHLHYVPTPDGSAVLAWDLVVRTPDGLHWYDLSIDASAGAMVAQNDWVDNDSYNVIPIPNESPQDGGFAVQTNPADATASPYGWHDTNGAAGAEFTDTRGNNVDAHLDTNADNVPDADEGGAARPDGGSSLDFSGYTFDASQGPGTTQNQNIAQVNLFYVNNIAHDIHYHYGFTEAAGNFQVNNYGNGGSANDAVQADAQDGSGTNNANFATPADGSSPRMQMFDWTDTSPNRDSDLDSSVIFHEYGHGVSNRLTGGPANSNALNAVQSGGMGEGWSDFYALMFLQRATDTQSDGYGIGTYVVGQPQSGVGIRRFRYSYDTPGIAGSTDPLTFDAYGASGTTSYGVNRSTEVHNTGELWTSTLWDMNWLLINKYGYDSNLDTGWTSSPGAGHAGNKLALRLVMDAMKLQPANPSFLQARDAIIAADNALNGGADLLQIWTAFARRGLGANASTSSSSSTSITVDFTIPAGVGDAPAVTSSTANLPYNAPGMVIHGTNFNPNPAFDSVTFNDGATGTVLPGGDSTTLYVSLSGLGSGLIGEPLDAIVTANSLSSGSPVQVATIGAYANAPTVTPSTTSVADSSMTITINGSNFDATPANDAVAFNLGVVGSVTAATTTQLTVTISTPPTALGSLTAVVISNGLSSGAPVQVAAEVNSIWIVTSSSGDAGTLAAVTLPYAVSHALGGDQITFSTSLIGDTITLSNSLTIGQNITITGLGAASLAVSGNNSVQGFFIQPGVTANISGLTIEDCYCSAYTPGSNYNNGGAVTNSGSLTLSNCMLTSNSAAYGGAGVLSSGMLTLNDDTFTLNTAGVSGGALNVYTGGTAAVNNCTFFANTSQKYGGGILALGGVTMTNTTIAGNIANNNGGGVYNESNFSGGSYSMDNCIVAGNSSPTGPDTDCTSNSDPFSAVNYCLVGDTSGYSSSGGGNNLTGSPGLASSLANNGGPTQTLALLAGSAAIGAGDPGQTGTTSQNAVIRPSAPDIGAYQLGAVTITTLTDNGPNPSTYGQDVSFTATVSGGSAIDGETVFIEDASNSFVVVASPTLTNSAVNFTISNLPVGSHHLIAVYDGDTTHAGSNDSASSTPVIQVVNAAAAPQFVSIEVNGGAPQYHDAFGNGVAIDISHQNSVVEQILVTFNEPITLAPGAFSITPYSISPDGLPGYMEVVVNSGPNPNQIAPILNAPIQVGDGHQWIITFGNNAATTPNGQGFYVLKDGVYSLNIDHTKVTANSLHMAADVGGPGPSSFWALFGDTTFHDISGVDHAGYVGDGYSDASVGNADFQAFKACDNSDSTNYYAPPNYDVKFDANLDGSVANSDFVQFKTNYNADWQF
jgi:Fungalysin metallopeptidase (M36)/Bacterial Ig-like domain (group 3)/Fungalysin/Thermolysin Propeptide Motif